jgi:hypothetical protein
MSDKPKIAGTEVTGAELAAVTGLSPAGITRLAQAGVLIKTARGRYVLASAVQRIIARERADASSASPIDRARAALMVSKIKHNDAASGRLRQQFFDQASDEILHFLGRLKFDLSAAGGLVARRITSDRRSFAIARDLFDDAVRQGWNAACQHFLNTGSDLTPTKIEADDPQTAPLRVTLDDGVGQFDPNVTRPPVSERKVRVVRDSNAKRTEP